MRNIVISNSFLKVHLLILIILSACSDKPTGENSDPVKTQQPVVEKKEEVEASPGPLEKSLIEQGLVNIQQVDTSILVDLKYSTEDNFFGADVYGDLTKAYLPEDVAFKLKKAHLMLQELYPTCRFMVFDAVRPHGVQQILWRSLDSIPPLNRAAYVADPAEGSLHNYGCAIDLSIFDLAADSLLDMGTKYDYFGALAYPRKEDYLLSEGLLTLKQVENRKILRGVMEKAGFTPITSEWWHFNSTSLANAKIKYPRIE